MNQSLKKMLIVNVCLFALTGQANADSLSEAQIVLNSGNYKEAAKLFIPLANMGIAPAQASLGAMYANGQGVLQDYIEAFKWYQLAAEQGDADAQTSLGGMYYSGRGVPQDFKEAAKWHRLAAEQGNASSQWSLGLMYKIGQGVPVDLVLAHMWINIAAANAVSKIQDKYMGLRNSVAVHMTTNEIAEARELARKCIANKFKGC